MSASTALPIAEPPGVRDAPKCLLPLNVAPSAPMLICPHAIDGSPLIYRQLVDLMTPRLQVFGFEGRGFLFEGKPFASVEAMAAHYVRELRALQPRGPYRLFGFSSGGLLALEIARQLRAAGGHVPMLVLGDTLTSWLADTAAQERFDWCLFAEMFIAKELSDAFYRDPQLRHPFWAMAHDDKLAFLSEQRRTASGTAATALEETQRHHETFKRYVLTYQRYQPADDFDGPAVFMSTSAASTMIEQAVARLRLRNCRVIPTGFRSHLQLVFPPGAAATADFLIKAATDDARPG